ncbi:helix-turn-helix transcriptional regulator [Flavobacterium sp. ANB]|uniref:helix-turn-helix domain-containing protein n=1 Tax=unclassified Flavobacterium TaxID=196869 RepID=UPI0012B8396E|nr:MULTISPECIES: helix-turn-helix transcriptional regulator [unclassified Flavobacterium]MBF4516942.1 helix-turn-helix transcriptional regulator [Flavobacterium sp. ANB]MTD69162.1 helix-turn-helix domain-containing protein [Flavobacterium sp. LC2016-13]
MAQSKQLHIKTITEFHRLMGLPQPENPLISIVDYAKVQHSHENNPISAIFDFYSISIKRGLNFKLLYGQQEYDFDEGIMFFLAPGQVLKVEIDQNAVSEHSGWLLLIHPDFIWNTTLAKSIKKYHFFNYSVNESLFLSQKEEAVIDNIIQNVQQEYHSNIDKFSHDIIIAQLEVLLNYAERFYQRQFLTRRKANHKILENLEIILNDYFDNEKVHSKGLPTVNEIAEKLNVSPNYLSELLKVLTAQNTQQHIHQKVIEKAKLKLSTTNLSASEIAYELGFEHPQSFSKFFKTKTSLTPLEFRNSFN